MKEENFKEKIEKVIKEFNIHGIISLDGDVITSKETLIKTILEINTKRRINGMTSLSDKDISKLTTDIKVSKTLIASEDLERIYEEIKALNEAIFNLQCHFTDIRKYATTVETDEDKKGKEVE